MARLRKIDQRITQTEDPQALLYRLNITLNAAWTEARLSFQRQLENYEILSNRIKQLQESLPKNVPDTHLDPPPSDAQRLVPYRPPRKKLKGSGAPPAGEV